jgi:hypothetical protein
MISYAVVDKHMHNIMSVSFNMLPILSSVSTRSHLVTYDILDNGENDIPGATFFTS